MNRLLPAALLALAIHGLFFLLQPLETRPPRLKAARRPVTLNLAHFVPTAPVVQKAPSTPTPPKVAPPPPKPRPKPQPKPKPRPKPQPKPNPRLKPQPKPQPKPKTDPDPVAPAPAPAEMRPAVEETQHPTDNAQAATEVATVADPGPVQAAPLVEATPLYAHNPPPRYPRSARKRGRQGTVLLSVRVTIAGRVDDLSVKASSGHSALDKAALDAVRAWRFEPGRRGETPVATWVEVPIEFKLQ